MYIKLNDAVKCSFEIIIFSRKAIKWVIGGCVCVRVFAMHWKAKLMHIYWPDLFLKLPGNAISSDSNCKQRHHYTASLLVVYFYLWRQKKSTNRLRRVLWTDGHRKVVNEKERERVNKNTVLYAIYVQCKMHLFRIFHVIFACRASVWWLLRIVCWISFLFLFLFSIIMVKSERKREQERNKATHYISLLATVIELKLYVMADFSKLNRYRLFFLYFMCIMPFLCSADLSVLQC